MQKKRVPPSRSRHKRDWQAAAHWEEVQTSVRTFGPQLDLLHQDGGAATRAPCHYNGHAHLKPVLAGTHQRCGKRHVRLPHQRRGRRRQQRGQQRRAVATRRGGVLGGCFTQGAPQAHGTVRARVDDEAAEDLQWGLGSREVRRHHKLRVLSPCRLTTPRPRLSPATGTGTAHLVRMRPLLAPLRLGGGLGRSRTPIFDGRLERRLSARLQGPGAQGAHQAARTVRTPPATHATRGGAASSGRRTAACAFLPHSFSSWPRKASSASGCSAGAVGGPGGKP